MGTEMRDLVAVTVSDHANEMELLLFRQWFATVQAHQEELPEDRFTIVATGKLRAVDATIPTLAGLSTNTISKVVFAVAGGGRSFALRVIPGWIMVALLAWAGGLYILIGA